MRNRGTGAEGWIWPGFCVRLALPLRSVQGSESCNQGRREAGHSAFKASSLWFVMWGQGYTDWDLQMEGKKAEYYYVRRSKFSGLPPSEAGKTSKKYCLILQYFAGINILSWSRIRSHGASFRKNGIQDLYMLASCKPSYLMPGEQWLPKHSNLQNLPMVVFVLTHQHL